MSLVGAAMVRARISMWNLERAHDQAHACPCPRPCRAGAPTFGWCLHAACVLRERRDQDKHGTIVLCRRTATGVLQPRTHLRSISSCFCLALRVSSDIGTIVDLPGPLASALAVLLEDAPVAAHDAPLWSVQQLPQPAEQEAPSTRAPVLSPWEQREGRVKAGSSWGRCGRAPACASSDPYFIRSISLSFHPLPLS